MTFWVTKNDPPDSATAWNCADFARPSDTENVVLVPLATALPFLYTTTREPRGAATTIRKVLPTLRVLVIRASARTGAVTGAAIGARTESDGADVGDSTTGDSGP
jgi:hypothetical protein